MGLFGKLASIAIRANIDKVVNDNSLELILSKSKKTKMAKSKILANSKNSTNLSKIISTTVGAMKFLTVEVRITFTQIQQGFSNRPTQEVRH